MGTIMYLNFVKFVCRLNFAPKLSLMEKYIPGQNLAAKSSPR